MVKDDHMTGAKDSPAPRGVRLGTAMILVAAAAGVTVVAVLLLRGFLGGQPTLARDQPTDDNDKPSASKDLLFKGWPQGGPEFALLLSGQQHGYILPCGCSRPQKGGLERRFNLLQDLTAERKWPVVALDLGDIPQKEGPAKLPNIQGNLKYVYSMKALKEMGYSGVGIGEYETAVPLEDALAAYALNEENPRILAGNIKAKEGLIPENTTAPFAVVQVPQRDVKVGVISLVGASVADKVKHPQLAFDSVRKSLEKLLPALDAQKPKIKVLLYQGSDDEAKKLAAAFPQFQAILCLSDEDEPPATPVNSKDDTAKHTMIVSIGHKGKHVGVVGFFTKADGSPGFDMRYQMVELNEDYLTPAKKEADHPIVKLMEKYTAELKRDQYLARYPQVNHPLQAKALLEKAKPPLKEPAFAGSEACKNCHEAAYKVWEKTPHAHAYKTLVDATRPSNRQFDGECIVCHTIGFGYKTGFPAEAPGPKGTTRALINVGCESCHGPCSSHVKDSENPAWYPLINPYKHVENENPAAKARRTLQMDTFCQKCHDADNDVHWDFATKWPKIIHHTP